MKNLAVDARMLFSSGIGVYLTNLLSLIIPSLSEYGIYLLCDIDKIKKCNYEWAYRENVRLVNCTSKIYTISEQFELMRKIPKEIDLFWSPHYNIPVFYGGLLVTTIHDVFHISDENADKTFFKNIYARTMLGSALRKSKLVFTDSQFTLSEMKKYKLSHLEKVKVIHIGISYKERQLSDINGTGERKHILFVGNVKPHKNIGRLIEAYQILREKQGITEQLVIVGQKEKLITGAPQHQEEINKLSLSKFITFTGKISDRELAELYREAAVLVLPSLYEGFGLPPLEAMSFGCPVVVSDAASLPEVCGEAALYCDPFDIEDMAEKIYRVLTNKSLRDTLIKTGFDQLKKYSWKKAANEYIQQFRSII